jgi:hypothetical protein
MVTDKSFHATERINASGLSAPTLEGTWVRSWTGTARTKSSLGSRLLIATFAGVVGTCAMDALLYRRYRDGGGTEQALKWEFSSEVKGWEGVSAPGLVGKGVQKRLLGSRELPKGGPGRHRTPCIGPPTWVGVEVVPLIVDLEVAVPSSRPAVW